jgi:hypothetical protein
MIPNRDHLKRMLPSLDLTSARAAKYHADQHDFRTTLRAFVRLLMLEATEADQAWIKGQLEEMLVRHGLKNFEL